jgi:hypothetical protein
MSAAAAVSIFAAVVVVLVLAGFLLAIARVLAGVSKQLDVVIGAVGEIAARTAPVTGVVDSINNNLSASADLLTGLLVSKVGAEGAANLIASVDPLATNGAAPPPPRPTVTAERPAQLPPQLPPTEAPTRPEVTPRQQPPAADKPPPPEREHPRFSAAGEIRLVEPEEP